tara:strand:+ start:74 stop:922 length:849 start_codon:yes stop_codon:yes gene_type:complete
MAKTKVATKGLSLFNRGLESLITTAQKALNSGVSQKAVRAATAPVRGANATVGAVKKADQRLIDLITRQKRSTTGRAYTTKTKTGAARFQKKGENKVKRGIARTVVYGGAAAGGAKVMVDSAKERAAERRKAQRGKDAEADFKKGKAAQAERFKKYREDATATGTGSGSTTTKKGRRLKGKFMPRVRPFKGKIAKVLLGKDEQFGGDAGLIDPDLGLGIRRKNMGGMMKSKGSAKGGMMGGKMPRGMKKGGAAKKTKGYSRGGAVKRRGVGAAQRGFGKAMK